MKKQSELLTYLLVFLSGFGLAARPLLSWISYGTNDVTSWYKFGSFILEHGIGAQYHADKLFNHPPLAGFFAASMVKVAGILELPFPFVFRLPGIFTELGCAILIWRIMIPLGAYRAALSTCVFCCSLISLLVSGYHGNTDPLYAFFVLLALVAVEERGTFFFGGLMLGCAANIKIIPLLFLPAFLFPPAPWRARAAFLGGLLLALTPFGFGYFEGRDDFLRNVFRYNSQLEYWGVELFLLLAHSNLPTYSALLLQLAVSYQRWARYVIGGTIVLFCGGESSRTNRSRYELVALSFIFFAVLAPGFAAQYFVVLTPLLALLTPGWGFFLSTTSGLFAASSYYQFFVPGDLLRSVHTSSASKSVAFVGFIAWASLVLFLVEHLRKDRRGKSVMAPESYPS